MQQSKYLVLAAFVFCTQLAYGAANLFFFKAYSDDFKKTNTQNFMAGDPIYGLINVSAISVNENTTTSLDEFVDQNGGVLITLYFPGIDRQIRWKMAVSSGRIKNNRFLFCLMPESMDKLDEDYIEVLKALNQQSGKKVTMQVQVGQQDVTAVASAELYIDLTGGAARYGEWLNAKVPASERNSGTFYNICETKSQTYIDLHRDELTVKTFTRDSIRFISSGTPYFAKKIDGYGLLQGGKDVASFYAWYVDDNSFVINQPGMQAWVYYHKDKSRGSDENLRCPMAAVETMKNELKSYDAMMAAKGKQQQAESDAQFKADLTKYVREAKSRRPDPVLEKKIFTWWNAHFPDYPAIKAVIIDVDFEIERDKYNQPLRKTIGAFVAYKGTQGTCWMQMNRFGYEHLGGGAFNDELGAWKMSPGGVTYAYKPVSKTVFAGGDYPVDCAGLK